MIDLTLDQLKALGQQSPNLSLSLYLPTVRAGRETQQNPIRLKNLLQEADQRLADRGMGPRDVAALLQPAQALLEKFDFWQHQHDSLAVFLTTDDFRYFRLPFTVDDLLVIARSYYVKPLLPLFTHNGHYYTLALSQGEFRLFEGTQYSVGQIDLPEGTPDSLDAALRYEDPEKELQFHSGTAPAPTPGGTRAGIFHGHSPDDDEKNMIARGFNLLDRGLQAILSQANAPLVLAGVDYLLPIYREVSDYAHIMDKGIAGNPEQFRPEELQQQTWPIVEPHFRQETDAVIEQYQARARTDQAKDDLSQIVAAAHYGRVDKLLLATGAQAWGTFDSETGQVTISQAETPEDDALALLDFAALQTLENSGSVYAMAPEDIPGDSPVLALLRY